jgi:6-hydroxypseudooxynicotine dehydrogenase subunit alpha
MKPPPVAYDRPATVAEALALLARHGEDAKLLAGGQSLIPLLNFRLARPERLIDIGRLDELAGIAVDGATLRIGALTRMSRLLRDPRVGRAQPLLVDAAENVAHMQIRNRGTVGGSVAHADPAAELPAALLALDARIRVRSATAQREIAADDFFAGVYTTALRSDEMLTEIVVPAGGVGAFEEHARRSGDFALGAVACQVGVGERGDGLRLAAIGLGGRAVRLSAAEAALAGGVPEPADVRRAVASELSDHHERADAYVKRIVEELATRAYVRARRRQGERDAG